MKRLAIISVFMLLLTPCRVPALQTLAQLQANYNAGNQVVIGVMGASDDCGYRAPGTYQGGVDVIAPTLTTGTFGGQATSATMALSVSGWAQLLNKWLQAKNPTSIVQNLSGSGWTVGIHLANGTVAQMAAMNPKPTHVFIPLVVNSRGYDNININLASMTGNGGTYYKGGYPYSTYQTYMATLVSQVIAAGMTPILVKELYLPFEYGAGDSLSGHWYWLDYEYIGNAPVGNPANHTPYSTYISYLDTLANSSTCTGPLGSPCPVLDLYTPTQNTGQVATYTYDTGRPQPGNYTNDAAPLGTAYDTAPALFRSDLQEMWISDTVLTSLSGPIFDPLHPNAGHAIILAQYQAMISGVGGYTVATSSTKTPLVRSATVPEVPLKRTGGVQAIR